ncbi:MAG: hypothetical protein ACFFEY_11205 [Candidatus Thorarchaeota archaeon]
MTVKSWEKQFKLEKRHPNMEDLEDAKKSTQLVFQNLYYRTF